MTDDELARIEAIALDQFHPYATGVDVLLLTNEIRRLRAGEFTEEEFQNLCHKFSGDDARRFALGCLEYNCKLFGAKQMLELKK